MNTAELAEKIATEHDLPKTQAKRIVESLLQTIADSALKGEDVALAGFGKFKIKERPERQGLHPRTREPMTFAAARKLTFEPAKAIRDAINR